MRILLASLLTSALVLIGGAAGAGGPTSVLVTNPASARATGIYVSDPNYADLDQALHAGGLGGTVDGPGRGATYFNLSWMIHDVSVWRVDQLAVSEDGVWVSTTDAMAGTSEPGPWREVEADEMVRAVLDDIGLVGLGTPAVSQGVPPAVPPDSPGAAEPDVRTETTWFALAGWRWAVPGLLIGAVATALLRRGRDDAPRQELVERLTVPG